MESNPTHGLTLLLATTHPPKWVRHFLAYLGLTFIYEYIAFTVTHPPKNASAAPKRSYFAPHPSYMLLIHRICSSPTYISPHFSHMDFFGPPLALSHIFPIYDKIHKILYFPCNCYDRACLDKFKHQEDHGNLQDAKPST